MAALRLSETCEARDAHDRFHIEYTHTLTHYEWRLGCLKYAKQEKRETNVFILNMIPLSLTMSGGLRLSETCEARDTHDRSHIEYNPTFTHYEWRPLEKHAKQETRETTDFILSIIPHSHAMSGGP